MTNIVSVLDAAPLDINSQLPVGSSGVNNIAQVSFIIFLNT